MKTDCLVALDSFYSAARALVAYTIFSCHEIHQTLNAEQQLSERWADFETLRSQDWIDIRASVDGVRSGYLLVYGMRMAFLSVRAKEQVGIWHGVMGIVLAENLDYRDVLSVATLLYDAAIRLGAKPDVLFDRGLRHASPKRHQLLESFLGGPQFTKSIESKGFRAVGSGSDFIYKCSTE